MDHYPVIRPSEIRPRRAFPLRSLFGALVGSAATIVLYLAFLSWNATKVPHACTGPYKSGQVTGLALALAAVVAICAAWRGEWGAAAAASVTVTVLFIADAITVDDPCNVASIWPVGAAVLLLGSAVGLGLIAALSTFARLLLRRQARGRDATITR